MLTALAWQLHRRACAKMLWAQQIQAHPLLLHLRLLHLSLQLAVNLLM
jgi:hypothetical protein